MPFLQRSRFALLARGGEDEFSGLKSLSSLSFFGDRHDAYLLISLCSLLFTVLPISRTLCLSVQFMFAAFFNAFSGF